MKDDTTRSATDGGDRAIGLLVVHGTTRWIPLHGEIVIGRGEEATLRIEDDELSRAHARFASHGNETTVEDLGSKNGTRVGGAKIAAHTPLPFGVGDVAECGSVMLLLSHAPREARSTRLAIGPDARWMQRDDGDVVNLGRRGALRLLLEKLVAIRLDAPGRALSTDAMFEAGWPGERIAAESAQARVYTSVQRLRALGLEGILITQGDGYLLDPRADVTRG
jgi:hypothetical protein